MTPAEMLLRLILGLLAIGAFGLLTQWIAARINETTIDPVHTYARRLARRF